jgi:hypothetical protein
MMGRKSQEHSVVLNTTVRNHNTSMHDNMIYASPGLHPNKSTIPNTKEFYEEQDEKENFPSKPGESPEGCWQLTSPPLTSSVTSPRSRVKIS